MYDNICKFLAATYPQDLAQWLLGEPIPFSQLQPSELALAPIHADSLILLQSQDLLLHLEFQTRPDPEIPFRMLDYWTRSHRKFPQHHIKQIVLYLKPTIAIPPDWRTDIQKNQVRGRRPCDRCSHSDSVA
ncbi:hypothetical protein GlitD10_0768 [Gloeomargarita lithophora Alchichica-D10]|uniref:Rpn family recombination-promoting nuclease/putative transposase n=1 Tax=Gloeomargarita lithophora Alchichica-D10 TaxID=1188229 RepID=A0A1J0AAX5_9CYAN|nr:hypothetical protein [Gloeomargarita lithophora]APB33082.1 hypothetical protein GlitD10_0768 [Gloeomargarita lithophora Alchichica-D10]